MKVYRYNSSRFYVRLFFVGTTSLIFFGEGLFMMLGPLLHPKLFSAPLAGWLCMGGVGAAVGAIMAWGLYAYYRPIAFPSDEAIARHVVFGSWKVVPWSEVIEVSRTRTIDRFREKPKTIYRVKYKAGSFVFDDEISGIRAILLKINEAATSRGVSLVECVGSESRKIEAFPVSGTTIQQLAGATPEEPAPVKW